MTGVTSNDTLSSKSSTKIALDYVCENPNNRRIFQANWEIIVEWLTVPFKRPSSQKEFSRHNYGRKTFVWGENTRSLLAIGKSSKEKHRFVVTKDIIADVVESIYKQNEQLG